MTPMIHKPSLLGRVRSKDLQEKFQLENSLSVTPAQKILLDMQENLEADRISRHRFEQEAFEYLLELHRSLKNPHQAVRVLYSLSEQNRRSLDAIKKVINHYGEQLKPTNLSSEEIRQKCQDLLDALVSRLSREGVKLRALSLIFER